jgi:hypothetical protein
MTPVHIDDVVFRQIQDLTFTLFLLQAESRLMYGAEIWGLDEGWKEMI